MSRWTLQDQYRREFETGVRARGETYVRNGRIQKLVRGTSSISARVRGSKVYRVELNWGRPFENAHLGVSCDCPFFEGGQFCKHIWSAFLMIDRTEDWGAIVPKRPLFQGPTGAADDWDGDEDYEEEDDDNEVVRSRITRGVWPTRPDDWSTRLDRIRQRNTLSLPTPSPRKFRDAFYVINRARSQERRALVIDFWSAEVSHDGQPGTRKPNKIATEDIIQYRDSADRELLRLLVGFAGQADNFNNAYWYGYARARYSSCTLPAETQSLILPRLLSTGRVFLGDGPDGSPQVWEPIVLGSESEYRLALRVDKVKGAYVLRGDLVGPAGQRFSEKVISLWTEDGWFLAGHQLGRAGSTWSTSWIEALREKDGIWVPLRDGHRLVHTLLKDPHSPELDLPQELRWSTVTSAPRPLARFHQRESEAKHVCLTLLHDYEGNRVESFDPALRLFDPEKRRIFNRDFVLENISRELALSLGASEPPVRLRSEVSLTVHRSDFPRLASGLLDRDWEVVAEGKKIQKASTFELEVKSGTDWFDLKAAANYGGALVMLPELLASVRRGDHFVKLGDGTLGVLPEEWLSKLAPLTALGSHNDSEVRFQRHQAIFLDAWLADAKRVKRDRGFRSFQSKLRGLKEILPGEIPDSFVGDLRPYQREGLGWLEFLDKLGIGGILADDMGLGKTIQCLAFLARRHVSAPKSRKATLPSIVVVPKSLIFNWIEEAARFAPRLKVLNYTGSQRAKLRAAIGDHDLIVTTYQTLRLDIDTLREIEFDCAVLDEAHCIKNTSALMTKACHLLRARFRLAMTGTPIENSIGDLFSLMEFTTPGLLGNGAKLQISRAGQLTALDSRALEPIARALKPLVLKRTKEKVLPELPPKMEQTLYCELSPSERRRYDELRIYYQRSLTKKIQKDGFAKSKIQVLEALLRLRQASCHPGLIDPRLAKTRSSKVDLLIEQLKERIEAGHKALVFSQFTKLLAVVRDQLDAFKIPYEYLDGKTGDRKKIVDRFQTDGGRKIFLISLKAGGVGLNLTAADYVFLLDPWWNPSAEMQAIDRTHRIGQTRKVIAYKLIAKDTVEEKILDLQKKKRGLANALISERTSSLGKVSFEELQALLS